MTMLDKELQSENTPFPMRVTLSGITTLRKEEYPLNAQSQTILVPFLME